MHTNTTAIMTSVETTVATGARTLGSFCVLLVLPE